LKNCHFLVQCLPSKLSGNALRQAVKIGSSEWIGRLKPGFSQNFKKGLIQILSAFAILWYLPSK
jgi:TRAP-type C4-dicarboxylate transport system permease large subunit